MWGDTDPDAANYADLDGTGTSSPDGNDDLDKNEIAADRGTAADTSQADQDQLAELNAEETLPPEHQRISALEAENADARQQLADAKQQIADLKADNGDQSARLDRIEQMLAGSDHPPNSDSGQDRAPQHKDAPAEHQDLEKPTIAAREATDAARDTKEAEKTRWRRIASAENVGIASAVAGAADTLAQFAMHATPEGVVGLGATVLGLASLGLAKVEEKRKRTGRRRHDCPGQRQG